MKSTLVLLLAIACMPLPLAASNCSKSCPNPAPSPECDGVMVFVNTRCNGASCVVTIKANGNGGSESTEKMPDSTSTEAFDICVGAPPCCVRIFPCVGNWASVAADCGALCIECS